MPEPHGRPTQLVSIEWIDPWSHSGWAEEADADAAAERDLGCITVGWIVRETAERYVIAGSLILAESGLGDLFAIPKRVIDRVTPLVALTELGEPR